MRITRAHVIKANQELIRNNGKARELTPLEKYANCIIENSTDTFENKEVIEEFNKLDFSKRIILIYSAKLRHFLNDLYANHPEKIQKAYQEAVDNVCQNKLDEFNKKFPANNSKQDSTLKSRIINFLNKLKTQKS